MYALCHTPGQGLGTNGMTEIMSSPSTRWDPARGFSVHLEMHPWMNSGNIYYLLHAGPPPNLYYAQYSETFVEKTPDSKKRLRPSDPGGYVSQREQA